MRRRRSVLVPAEERFIDTADPVAYADVYFRHRDGVRAALEACGLAAIEAERLVGDVFVLMMDQRAVIDRSKPLADTLVGFARTVAASHGYGDAAFAAILRWIWDHHKPGPDGYYGSGG